MKNKIIILTFIIITMLWVTGCSASEEIKTEVIPTNTEFYPIGWLSGLPDEMKADPNKVAFIPIEVTAMEYDSFNHTLRHGKMVGWRKDLLLSDCTLSKIEN